MADPKCGLTLWVSALGPWDRSLAFNSQQLSDDPNTLFLSHFIPLPKLSSASAFQPGGTQPVTKDPWGAQAWTYATWRSLHKQSLFQNPLLGWLGLSQICVKVSWLFPHTSLLPLLFIFFPGISPHPPTNPPPRQKRKLCPPISISAWVSQRAQLMLLKNHP